MYIHMYIHMYEYLYMYVYHIHRCLYIDYIDYSDGRRSVDLAVFLNFFTGKVVAQVA